MLVKVNAKRQITFPAKVLEALGVKAGGSLLLERHPDGFVLRSRIVDSTMLAPLRGRLRQGKNSFNLETIRKNRYSRMLRI